jgi:hypothetical protein
VTVTGTGFVSGQTTIRFGAAKAATMVNCVSWDVNNPSATTTCTVTSPAHSAETVNVRAIVNKAISPKVAADRYTFS